jgi:nucleoside-diphosphate-sugar epimerase
MRALVTGSDGFVGHNLCRKLRELDVEVHPFDIASGQDLRRFGQIRDSLKKFEPEKIFHVGAVAGISRSFKNPRECFTTNVVGTFNLLEAIRVLDLDAALVFSGSSSVYGNIKPPQSPRVEYDPLSVYPASKAMDELLLLAYHRCYDMPVVLLRYFNVYGPLAEVYRSSTVIAQFMTQVAKGEPPTIIGDGEQKRDFTYVDDVVSATIEAGQRKEAVGEILNVGTGVAHSINTVARKILDLFGSDLEPVHVPERPYVEPRHICADTLKTEKVLGFRAKISLDEGLRKYYDYLCTKNFQEGGGVKRRYASGKV